MVTSGGPHSDLFPLICRHADWLGKRFQQVLGYRLLVDSSYARLFKSGLGAGAGRRLERSTGTPFTPHTYACLALALSVLVTAPEQLLLSQLVADIRAAAADAEIELEETGRAGGKRTLDYTPRVTPSRVRHRITALTRETGQLGAADIETQLDLGWVEPQPEPEPAATTPEPVPDEPTTP
ncbi:DUF2398 family protein [Streptomyces sp. NPDC028635]|uniref:DUF2398 family protein n=1 Tax=Streptomyces sp. NPDC028635 TaxID=3154800 RepID=UPI0033D3E45A